MKTNLAGWALSGLGLFLLIVNGALLKDPVRLLIAGERAQGIVVDMAESKKRYYESPIVEFVTSTGERVRVTGRGSSSSPSAHVGDAVKVVYSPSQPRDARLLLFGEFVQECFFLVFGGLFLVGWIALPGSQKKLWISVPGSQRKLKGSGVPAIATVIEANPETRFLQYRIDKETRMPTTRIPTANLDSFISLENTLYDWKPAQADAGLKRGDQFRAYLDPLKPSDNFYIDFSDRIGHDPSVKSMEDESIEEDEDEKS